MSDKPKFVIILTDGRAENVADLYCDWHALLRSVHQTVQTSGGGSALPNQLLVNGEVVVAKDLHQIAWQYGTDRQRAIDDAIEEVDGNCPQPWRGEE